MGNDHNHAVVLQLVRIWGIEFGYSSAANMSKNDMGRNFFTADSGLDPNSRIACLE
jgi:hypothetical protein